MQTVMDAGGIDGQLYLENKFGFEKAEFFWNIGLDAVKNVTNLISKYNIDCALKPGILHAGNTKKDYYNELHIVLC